MARAASTIPALALVVVARASVSADERTAEQQRACGHDALSLCLSEVPDVDRITACMKRNLDKLSARCRAEVETARRVR